MLLLAVLIFVPLLEIALFIVIGGWLTLWPTLGIVIATAIMGSIVLRRQGAQALGRIRDAVDQLRDPSGPLLEGAMILFAGALLLTPGFFTDAVGFLLLVPAARAVIIRTISARARVKASVFRTGHDDRFQGDSGVIDAAYEDVTERRGGSSAPDKTSGVRDRSGWVEIDDDQRRH